MMKPRQNASFVKSIGNQVDLLSNAENLEEAEYINLRLASIFMLTGYIADYDKPLEGACQIAEEVLSRFGFSKNIIDSSKKIITNSFSGKLESLSDDILHDAKYDYFGRVDFIKLTEKLLKEETEYGLARDKKVWMQKQLKLLSEHDFITSTAKLLRSVPSEDQVATLQTFIKDEK
jgi:hypothetical protein